MLLVDTHCHINFKAFKDDADRVIKKALENNIWVINVGSMYKTSQRAVELANNYKEGVYASVAVHPIHLKTKKIKNEIDLNEIGENEVSEIEKIRSREEFDYDKYLNLAKNKKVVGIGETGLDYYRIKEDINETKKLQKEIFSLHINLAKELNKPLIIHCRLAHNDLYQILKSEFKNGGNGVLHCFSGDYDLAKKYLNLNFFISFTGIITFSNQYNDTIKKIPLSKLMIETDAPYLTPIPYRGKRNEPIYVKQVAYKIAEIKNIKFEKVAEATTQNAKSLFKI